MGLMIPLACNTNSTPTGSTNGGRFPSTTVVPTATFQSTPGYIGTISTGISGPNGLAYSSGAGVIYVAEGFSGSVSQVQVLNSSTYAVNSTWMASGLTNFQFPDGVAVNSAGTTVYVLDAGNPTSGAGAAVYALAPSAVPTPITSWTQYSGTTLSYPSGIALDANENVYVADTGNDLLEVFGAMGTPVASWSYGGNSNFGPVYPEAVAVDAGGHVYVADGDNNELWVLTLSGSSLTVSTHWDLPFTSGSDAAPYGLTVDSNNYVYVADYFNSQVEVYNNTGTQLGLFTGNETGATPLIGPDALLVYGGNIYVADYDNNNVSSASGIVEIFGPNNY